MNLSVQKIEHEILALPADEQLKLINFIESLKLKLTKSLLVNTAELNISSQTEGQRIFQVLKEYDLLGCMKGGDGRLSENYKEHLWDSE